MQQTADVIELLKAPPAGEAEFLLELLVNRVPAGVDDAAKVKASYLAAVAFGSEKNALITRARATELLGTMLGGYNVAPLVQLLDDAEVGVAAANALKHTLLVFDAFHDVQEKAKAGNANAQAVLQSWADAESVSYTHLDVYKRQVRYCVQIRCGRWHPAHRGGRTRPPAPNGRSPIPTESAG